MRPHQKCSLSFLAEAATLVVCLAGCSQKPADTFQGYVEGKYVYVASPQSGRLDRLAIARGDTVAPRQPLFTLEPEPELSAEVQAREVLHSDEARLTDLQTGKRPPEKEVIAAQLAQAKAEHQKAVDTLKSDEAQFAAGGLSEIELIAARAAVEANAALVHQRQSELEVAALPDRDAQIEAQSKVVAADRAALQQASWKLQQKQGAATRGGLVFDTLYRDGEWVPAGSPIVQILPPDNIEVRFYVPEPILGKLKIGQSVSVHADGSDVTVPATVAFISSQVEYTPPLIYSEQNRSKLVFMVIAKPTADKASLLHPGQPISITMQ